MPAKRRGPLRGFGFPHGSGICGLTWQGARPYGAATEPYLSMNEILAGLPESELRPLAEQMELVWVSPGEVLAGGGLLGTGCYFPVNSVISTIATLEDGRAVGVGFVGREGVLGVQNLFGFRTGVCTVEVQVPGFCFRIETENLRRCFRKARALQDRLLLYFGFVYTDACQSIACNRAHLLHQRLCRWLLELRDRIESDELNITHESFSHLLGATRADTSRAAGKLQELNLLNLSHGKMTILDRGGLQAVSCECYGAARMEYVHSSRSANAPLAASHRTRSRGESGHDSRAEERKPHKPELGLVRCEDTQTHLGA